MREGKGARHGGLDDGRRKDMPPKQQQPKPRPPRKKIVKAYRKTWFN